MDLTETMQTLLQVFVHTRVIVFQEEVELSGWGSGPARFLLGKKKKMRWGLPWARR